MIRNPCAHIHDSKLRVLAEPVCGRPLGPYKPIVDDDHRRAQVWRRFSDVDEEAPTLWNVDRN